MMSRFGRTGLVLAVNLMLIAILAEAAAVGVYFLNFRELLYKRVSRPVIFDRPVRDTGWFGFHPYWGFSQKPGTDATFMGATIKANNHGFQDPRDYPVQGEPADFIVGVFGGSVAAGYRFAELKSRELENGLKALPQLRGRRPIVLNFAASSLKQPQQLLILNHYLAIGQRFDAIVTIDGFNELVSGSRNVGFGIDSAMPPYDTVRSLLLTLGGGNPTPLGLEYAWYQLQSRVHEKAMEECRLALCFWFYDALVRFDRHKIAAAEKSSPAGEQGERANFVLQPAGAKDVEDRAAMFGRIAQNWARSSAQMALLAARHNAVYLNVLQPNQYHKTERVFGVREAAVAFSMTSHVRLPAIEGYPHLLKALQKLRDDGVNAVDGTRMFDAELNAVYTDNCCHWEDRGFAILTRFIVAEIGTSLVRQPPR